MTRRPRAAHIVPGFRVGEGLAQLDAILEHAGAGGALVVPTAPPVIKIARETRGYAPRGGVADCTGKVGTRSVVADLVSILVSIMLRRGREEQASRVTLEPATTGGGQTHRHMRGHARARTRT